MRDWSKMVGAQSKMVGDWSKKVGGPESKGGILKSRDHYNVE